MFFTDLFNWKLFWEDEPEKALVPANSVHHQDDGIILAMCVTGTSSRDSLLSWIKLLQQLNPALAEIPVVFRLHTPPSELQTVKEVQQTKTEIDTT